jgi:hypothetical protein
VTLSGRSNGRCEFALDCREIAVSLFAHGTANLMTTVENVQKWYEAHAEHLSKSWKRHRFSPHESADMVRGKATLELESPTELASVTFWNKGDVTFIRLDLPSKRKEPAVVDDRMLLPGEDVIRLLESYLQQLTLSPMQ